jgi:Carboxypeptidase regulatory-like domain
MFPNSIFRRSLVLLATIAALLLPVAALAQQNGSIAGKVVDSNGTALPGVTVEARSDVLPGPRLAVTASSGEYRMPALPPGTYTITFTLAGMQTVTRDAQIQLAQEVALNVTLGLKGMTETVAVRADASLVDRDSQSIKSSLSADQMRALPVGQDYRDLIKFIPGVQYTQDGTRGPSSGGSGQDNVYLFDGVNVTLPLFGTLSAEPASHDIAQITTIKGGAKAVNFERSGGFAVDSVSKSGTNKVVGQVSYQILNHNMWAKLVSGSQSKYEQDRSWWDVNGGGPVMKDKVFLYASYYRPVFTRENRANLYGELPDYQSTRNEGFAKVTVRPANPFLLNLSIRNSHRFEQSDLFGASSKNTTGTGNEAWLKIGTAEGSWIIDANSFLTFKYTNFTNRTQGRPDHEANVTLSTAVGTRLDTANLDTLGLFAVPAIISGQTAYNDFVQPLIDKYGFVNTAGVKTGGGNVGFGSTFDKDDFFRDGGQLAYTYTLSTGQMQHELHAGYQRYTDAEDLTRKSNGWGVISVPGGRTNFQGTPIFYLTTFQQQSLDNRIPTIHSEYQSQSIELNDTIRWRRWSFNVGVMMSNDTLFGQGLVEDSSTLSGYKLPPTTSTSSSSRRYKMYEIPFSKMIQPRLGATWAYDGVNTAYFSYAKYNPAASSLPRAASWDRNLATTIEAYFDSTGTLFGSQNVASSSGKLFVPDMTPRTVEEYVYGTARQFGQRLTGRLYGRYRAGSHFWEDTNNTARTAFNPPAEVNGVPVPRELYIPDLTAKLAQIGSGSTYVIAELDGAYTKFYETTLEGEYKVGKAWLRGSYTWSHYYGNFDQDSTTTANDANIFIGSSFIADAAGRQLWDNRDGDLRGDRRHMFKLYGSYLLDFKVGNFRWDASVGAFFVAQSGQPWEAWSYEPYRALTTSTSDTSRFAEPAGSRISPAHQQVDLNYTQSFPLKSRFRAQIALDLFNVANKQTGYNYQPSVHVASFNTPRNFFDPRRFQIAMRLLF